MSYTYEILAGISFQIITYAGSAKSDAMLALYDAKEGKFAEAALKITSSHKNMIEAEKQHADLVQKEAGGLKIDVPLLLIHAEDQLLSTQTLILLVEEMIEMYKRMSETKSCNCKVKLG